MATKKKKTAAAAKTSAKRAKVKGKCHAEHPNCLATHGSKQDCPRTGAPGKVCARLYPENPDPNDDSGTPCGAVSAPDAEFCYHCRQPFPA
jgi:hypothetical protein